MQLTPQEESQIDSYYRQLLERANSPVATDELQLEGAIKKLYRFIGVDEPAVVWCESPWQMVVIPVLLQMLLKLGQDSPLWRRVELCLTHPRWAACRRPLEEALAAVADGQAHRRGNPAARGTDDEAYQELTRPGLPSWKAADWPQFGLPLGESLRAPLEKVVFQLDQELRRIVDAQVVGRIRGKVLSSEFTPRFLSPRTQVQQALEREVVGRQQAGWALDADLSRPHEQSTSPLSLQFCQQLEEPLLIDLEYELIGGERRWLSQVVPPSAAVVREEKLRSELDMRFSLTFRCVDWAPLRFPWLAFFSFPLAVPVWRLYSQELMDILDTWLTVCLGGFAFGFLSKVCLVCERPVALEVDEQGRLHHPSRSAIVFGDGFEICSWHGVTVPSRIIRQPETISVVDIDSERNIEVRRVMMERFGHGRYIMGSGAAIIDQDDCGVLYRREFADDEPLVMVEVKDATIQPDGSRRTYLLRVPPNVTSAREAVAWTFGMTGSEYSPDVET
jgi:hypothetical protein